MASIQKRPGRNGAVRYRVQVRLRGRALSATFPTKVQARQWATQVESGIQRTHNTSTVVQVTLGELLQRYRREVLPHKRRGTQANQAHHLDWWTEALGPWPMADVTPARLGACRDALAQTRAPGTVNQYLRTLSHAFSVAVNEWGWLDQNPLRRVRLLPEPRGRVRFLTDAERPRLLAACQASRNRHLYPLVVCALSTGARKMELLSLTWPQVDIGRAMITLHETKNGEPRSIPLTGPVVEVMRSHAKVVRLDTPLVFPRVDGRRPVDVRYAWYQALRQAEIEDFRFHDLRHSAASYLAMNGASLVEIADVLGHKTLAMVQRYTHLSEGHTRSVLDRMTSAMLGFFA
jgi:integrase